MELSVGSSLPNHENSQDFGHRAGHIEGQLRTAYRRAALWLAQRPVWAKRAPVAAELSRLALVEELVAVQREMLARTGVRVGIGAARTVTVARTASRAVAGGVCVVARGEERGFLAPLPLSSLDGLSGASLEVLRACGLVTIGELQRVPKTALQAELGGAEGLHIWRIARGLDDPRSAAPRLALSERARDVVTAKTADLRTRMLGRLFASWGGMVGEMLRRLAF